MSGENACGATRGEVDIAVASGMGTSTRRPPEKRGVPDPAWVAAVQEKLLAWFAAEGSDLPWRRVHDPYVVLVSEFMLQQTQRSRVVPKFLAFLDRFPTLDALAAAPAAAVIRAWSGLGYNRRALALHAIARRAMENGGALPEDREALLGLFGIGGYTAGAIACFGFGQQVAFVDTNIRRVLGRVFCGEPYPAANAKRDEALADAVLPHGRAYDWNSALMDLGARICVARSPRCNVCTLAGDCLARPGFNLESTQEQLTAEYGTGAVQEPHASREPGALRHVAEARADYAPRKRRAAKQTRAYAASDRYLRGRIVEALRSVDENDALSLPELALAATGMALPPEDERVAVLVERLVREGLVERLDQRGEGAPRFRLPA